MITKKPPVAQVQNIQSFIFDYLDTEVDPYDFSEYLPEWMKSVGIKWKGEDRPMADDLKPAQYKKFEQWLVDKEKGIEWISTGDIYAPAYLYFNEVNKLPIGTWCVHFTKADPFGVFDQGTTIEGLALSTHKREKDLVDCRKNLTDEIGAAEHVFGFAFEAKERGGVYRQMDVMSRGLSKYGDHAVLFQTDGAVRAWHIGDEEYQVIFPLCSEYNVVPMLNPDPSEIKVSTDSGEEVVFASLEDVIAYASR